MNGRKTYNKKKAIIAILFIVVLLFGFILGYFSHDFFTAPRQFYTGENILQNSGFEEGKNEY